MKKRIPNDRTSQKIREEKKSDSNCGISTPWSRGEG
jgi:hypothetical protein